MIEKLYTLIGFCSKAGSLIAGAESVRKAVKSEKAKLVLLDGSMSENSKKEFYDASSFRNIQIFADNNSGEIARASGKNSKKVFAVLDANFAEKMIEIINELAIAGVNKN